MYNSAFRGLLRLGIFLAAAAAVAALLIGLVVEYAAGAQRLDVEWTNHAGETIPAGSPVDVFSTDNASLAFTRAPGNATWIAGVLQSACANGTTCKVAVAGVGWVRLLSGCRNASGAYSPHQNCTGVANGTAFNTTASAGDWLIMAYADGQANATATKSTDNATIGRALSSNNGSCGSHRVKALIWIQEN